MIDLVNSITILLGHSIWGIPCAIWDLNESFPFIDYLISDLVFTAIALGYFPKLFLGMNRFFAIAFDGRFFKRFEQLKLPQYFLMIVYPFVCFVLLLLPGCYAVYIPYGQNLFYSESECGDSMINYTGNVEGVFFMPASSFFDLLVLILLHRRFRTFHKEQHQQSSQKARDLRREYRLAAQMVTNLFNGITVSIASVTFKTTFTTPLSVFIIVTALWLLTCLLSCMAYALFLGEKQGKVETRKVSTLSLGISKT